MNYIYISKDDSGVFHDCPKLHFAYNNWNLDKEYGYCILCQIKIPTYLLLSFNSKKISNKHSKNEYRIGNFTGPIVKEKLLINVNFIKIALPKI